MLAVPLAGCSGGYDDSPDPLSGLAAQARADATDARRLGGPVGGRLAELRAAQAAALQAEVDRANRPAAAAKRPSAAKDLRSLGKRLAASSTDARELLPGASRHRAGLLASVAAGCAGARMLAADLGRPATPRFRVPRLSEELDEAAVEVLQQALDAEHAAVWVYGLISAFLPAGYDDGLQEAQAEHRDRRDAADQVITTAGATPHLAEAAYRTPKPVTGAKSAHAAAITAEDEATVAWRGVIERCDEPELRGLAADAMAASAVRATRWRMGARRTPAAVPLPGQPA